MDKNIKNMLVDLVVGLLVIWALSPIASIFPFLYLMVPGFLALIAIRNQKYTGVLLLAILAVTIGLRTNKLAAIGLFLLYLPMLISIQILYNTEYHYEYDFSKKIGFLALSFILGFSLMFLTDYIGTGQNPKDLVINSVNSIETGYIQLVKNSDFNPYQVREFERAIKSATKTVLAIFPSIIIIVGALAGMLNAVFVEKFLYRFNLIKERSYFNQFKLPDSMPMGVALAFIMGYIMQKMEIGPQAAFFQNMVLIVSFFSLAQGMAILSDFLTKRNIKGVFRWLIYILAMAMPGLNFIVMAVGLLDSTLDLRKIRKKSPRR